MTKPVGQTRIGPDFDARDHGAIGDGQTKATVALQQAIDACSSAGGGRVVLPAGIFLVGTLYLKDNVTLHLTAGAVLLGSPDMADYNRDDAFPQNEVFAIEKVTGAHLIIGHEVRNIAIEGGGRIDGNSPAFLGPPDRPGGKFTIPGKRPGQMICLVECEDVRVENVALCDAPYWTMFLHGCANVNVRGVRIRNPPATPNGDGIDVDSCRNVVISDCIIRSGDDCITLRGNPTPLKDKTRACERITVTNCVLSTPCNAIRVGVGDGAVRNCVFSNLVITDTRNGICLIGNYFDYTEKGTDIENIRFNNVTMEAVLPFYIFTGRKTAARIRNVWFSDVHATASRASVIRGVVGCRLAGIHFRNVDLEIGGGAQTIAPDADMPALCWEWEKGRPTAIDCAFADDVSFDRVTVRWGVCDGPWRHALLAEQVQGLAIRDSEFPAPPTASAAEGVKRD